MSAPSEQTVAARLEHERRHLRERRCGNSRALLQTRHLPEVDRADDIDNGEFTRLTRNDRKAGHLVIVEGDVHIYILVFFRSCTCAS